MTAAMRLVRRLAAPAWGRLYLLTIVALMPVHLLLCAMLRRCYRPRSVVHIGELRHVIHDTVAALKTAGLDTTYVAVGGNPHWSSCDVALPRLRNPVHAAWRDSRAFWQVVARHEVIHCHCMMGISHYQWEFLLLRLLGRRVIAHFRGCEGRERARNMVLHAQRNICWDCDYLPKPLCEGAEQRRRRWVARRVADQIVVTTPDMLDFWPGATHVPFFPPHAPPASPVRAPWTAESGRPFRIVHVTNQPGIEATYQIGRVIERLRAKGLAVEFVHITGVSPEAVFQAYSRADLAIGKMVMGYYANAQIESLMSGLPTVCWVRAELRTSALLESGLVIANLEQLEDVVETLMRDRAIWMAKAAAARESALRLHDPKQIVALLTKTYGWTG